MIFILKDYIFKLIYKNNIWSKPGKCKSQKKTFVLSHFPKKKKKMLTKRDDFVSLVTCPDVQ